MGMNALEVRRRVMLAQPHEAVAVGAVASFRTDVLSPLKMSFDLLPIQTGEGDPSPENNRPITGHDGFTRNCTGKNLWNDDNYAKASWTLQTSGDFEGYYNGRAQSLFTVLCGTTAYGIFHRPLNLGRVTISFDLMRKYGSVRVYFMYEGDSSWTNHSGNITSSGHKSYTSSSSKNCIGVAFYTTAGQNSYDFGLKNVQVEISNTETAYQLFGHSYTTVFSDPPGTVYGGQVRDNGDGTYDLTVTMAGKWLSTLTWANNASYANVFNGSGFTNRKIQIDGTDGVALCDTYKFYTSYDVMDYDYGIALANTATGASRFNIYVKNKDCANKDEFVALLQEHDVFVVCPLQTPVQYTGLTLTALQSLIGQNHVWVDNADSVSVEYWGH